MININTKYALLPWQEKELYRSALQYHDDHLLRGDTLRAMSLARYCVRRGALFAPSRPPSRSTLPIRPTCLIRLILMRLCCRRTRRCLYFRSLYARCRGVGGELVTVLRIGKEWLKKSLRAPKEGSSRGTRSDVGVVELTVAVPQHTCQ